MQIHLSALRQQLVRSILGRKPNVFPPVCSPIYLYQQANLQMIMKAKMLTALAWRMGPEESRCVRGLCIISDRTQRSHTVSTTAECVGKALSNAICLSVCLNDCGDLRCVCDQYVVSDMLFCSELETLTERGATIMRIMRYYNGLWR